MFGIPDRQKPYALWTEDEIDTAVECHRSLETSGNVSAMLAKGSKQGGLACEPQQREVVLWGSFVGSEEVDFLTVCRPQKSQKVVHSGSKGLDRGETSLVGLRLTLRLIVLS